MPKKSQIKTKEETTSTQRRNSPQPQQPETAPAHDVTPAVALRRSISLLPHVPRPTDMLVLQRTVGNRAIGRLIQAKRKVGPGGDTYEREAQLRMQPAMQRVGVGGAEGFTLDDETAARINRARGSGQPLEGAVQKQMSSSLGYDFSGVRVHTGQEADKLNQQLRAQAFTTGPDIFFKRSAYDPASTRGQELIAHELSHVVQQSTSRLTEAGNGMTVRPPDDTFEQEAEVMARNAIRKSGAEKGVGRQASITGVSRVGGANRLKRLPQEHLQRRLADHVGLVNYGANPTCHIATWIWALREAYSQSVHGIQNDNHLVDALVNVGDPPQTMMLIVQRTGQQWDGGGQDIPPRGRVVLWTAGATHSAVITTGVQGRRVTGYNQAGVYGAGPGLTQVDPNHAAMREPYAGTAVEIIREEDIVEVAEWAMNMYEGRERAE